MILRDVTASIKKAFCLASPGFFEPLYIAAISLIIMFKILRTKVLVTFDDILK
jgi:hypothetical protein